MAHEPWTEGCSHDHMGHLLVSSMDGVWNTAEIFASGINRIRSGSGNLHEAHVSGVKNDRIVSNSPVGMISLECFPNVNQSGMLSGGKPSVGVGVF